MIFFFKKLALSKILICSSTSFFLNLLSNSFVSQKLEDFNTSLEFGTFLRIEDHASIVSSEIFVKVIKRSKCKTVIA